MVKKTVFLILAGLYGFFSPAAFAASKSASFQVSCIVPQKIEVAAASQAPAAVPSQSFYQEGSRGEGEGRLKLITVTA
jgi:hypothetical protein